MVTQAGGGASANAGLRAKGRIEFLIEGGKLNGYDEANGDWFYARYSPDGSVDVAGQGAITACADCHNTDTGVDRLLSQRDDPATTDE